MSETKDPFLQYPDTDSLNRVVHGFYYIRKNQLSDTSLEKHKNELSVTSKTRDFITDKPTCSFETFRENELWFAVPVHYGISEWGEPESWISDPTPIHVDLAADFSYRTDYDQRHVVESLIRILREKHCAQLCLDTGLGKTICTFPVIQALELKTLIIVHKDESVVQWSDKARKFLPGIKIGVLQASTDTSEGADMVMTTVQSLSRRGKYLPKDLESYGLVVADEVHLMAAEQFHLAFTKLRAKHYLALTATPERKDGLSCVIRSFFGNVEFKIDQPRKDVIVRVLHYKQGKQVNHRLSFGARKTDRAKMIRDLVFDPIRNMLIVKWAAEDTSCECQTLILTERVPHTKIIASKLTAKFEDMKLERTPTVSLLIGSLKEDARKEAKKADFIVATYAMAKDSLDLENPGRMCIATPVSARDIQQIRGRILRQPKEGQVSRNPEIYHVFDDWKESSMFTGMFWAVHKFYVQRRYRIRHEKDGFETE